eukprot:scaffold284180_cov32-Tisochrysis_lutea.AAC.4
MMRHLRKLRGPELADVELAQIHERFTASVVQLEEYGAIAVQSLLGYDGGAARVLRQPCLEIKYLTSECKGF